MCKVEALYNLQVRKTQGFYSDEDSSCGPTTSLHGVTTQKTVT